MTGRSAPIGAWREGIIAVVVGKAEQCVQEREIILWFVKNSKSKLNKQNYSNFYIVTRAAAAEALTSAKIQRSNGRGRATDVQSGDLATN